MYEDRVARQYKPLHLIGLGAFAKVYLAVDTRTLEKCAVKVIPKINPEDRTDQTKRIKNEIEIHKVLRHPFIVQLYDVIETPENFYLIMEYVDGCSLIDDVNTNGLYTESEAANIFAQIIIALEYLHSKHNLIHRDLKAENIMITHNKLVKIIDFGLSCRSNSKDVSERCGSLSYASPEIVLGKKYTTSHDIWSCGIVLYAIVCGHIPFEDEEVQIHMFNILNQEVEIPDTISPELESLIRGMLEKFFKNRFRLDQIINQPWLINKIREWREKLQVNNRKMQQRRKNRSHSLVTFFKQKTKMHDPILDANLYNNENLFRNNCN
ncbi:CAMK family protein kinase [Trichomonas vaginalis G3]|uniref:CAMK family protein kinase n=1 Tax=Trichomonas vaginalis (strain ATCC PRA-98 / G3) TaxID=412133 RepID=A2EIG6_TRIV3|nr:protein serine/threonine kinase protein [Trichomonas vaginalis G3]EAY07571.1 CAMK family protein kinase [Trichomonas vaginalis G3]KAI5541329.1 protein serine/threonine kinase protein [Trichomonas vaginalis G3]|eukprot:XP_001319794.1 CAMK family protein kinase [Trichomonas vaginalis G3]